MLMKRLIYLPTRVIRLAALLAAGCVLSHCGGGVRRSPGLIAVAPKAIDFGARPPGARAIGQVTLSNMGASSINLNSVRIEGDARGAFKVGQAPGWLDASSTVV